MENGTALTAAGVRVLDAASALFYADGIHPVGVALVAGTAGVTKKTLYDCFGSKSALVVSYLQRRHARWWAVLDERLATAPSPRVLALVDASLDPEGIDVSRGCAFLNAAAELPADHPGTAVVREHKQAVRRRLGELVAEVVAPALAEPLAEEIFLLLEGAVAHLRLGDRGRARTAREIVVRRLVEVSGGAGSPAASPGSG